MIKTDQHYQQAYMDQLGSVLFRVNLAHFYMWRHDRSQIHGTCLIKIWY